MLNRARHAELAVLTTHFVSASAINIATDSEIESRMTYGFGNDWHVQNDASFLG